MQSIKRRLSDRDIEPVLEGPRATEAIVDPTIVQVKEVVTPDGDAVRITIPEGYECIHLQLPDGRVLYIDENGINNRTWEQIS